MNNQTTQLIRFLIGTGSSLVPAAHAKLQDKSLAVGNMKNRDIAFRLALCSTVAQNAGQFSLSTLGKVDWKEVVAVL
jgi:hypothetical protein